MTPGISLCWADPQARVVDQDDALWLLSGIDERALAPLSEPRSRTCNVEEQLCRSCGDAAIVRLDRLPGHAGSLHAWRGLTSGYDVFYRLASDGAVQLSDHFRNLLSQVPTAEREPTQDVLCDHFLFRTVPGGNTLCRSVKRLGRGESLHIDLDGGGVRIQRFDRVETAGEPGNLEDYVGRVDHALESALGGYRDMPDAAALFSGGVDSTLMQTYLGRGVPAVNYDLPWYAEDFEAGYAERAAGLLGVDLERHSIGLDDCLERLEQAIDATALPPPHLQMVMYQPLLELDHRTLILGEQADALFGIELRKARLAAPFTSSLGQAALRAAEHLGSRRADRFCQIRQTAARLAEDPASLEGYGAQFGTYTSRPLLEDVFGPARVRQRLQARLEVARSIDQSPIPVSRFHHHVELAQMIDYFCEDIMSTFRHLAHARGRAMVSPFISGPVLRAALSVPAEQRYLRGLEGKYLLKELLKRRLPAYPVNQQKGYMHLPFADLYRSGPLATVWQRYPMPDLFTGAARERLIHEPTQMTWNAITLAIWRDRVQHRSDLAPIPGSRTFSSGGAAATARSRV